MGQLARNSEGPTNSDIPKSLTRRFEVTILPRATEIPRKLREVRANGIIY